MNDEVTDRKLGLSLLIGLCFLLWGSNECIFAFSLVLNLWSSTAAAHSWDVSVSYHQTEAAQHPGSLQGWVKPDPSTKHFCLHLPPSISVTQTAPLQLDLMQTTYQARSCGLHSGRNTTLSF